MPLRFIDFDFWKRQAAEAKANAQPIQLES
jgi:hypothetical protein